MVAAAPVSEVGCGTVRVARRDDCSSEVAETQMLSGWEVAVRNFAAVEARSAGCIVASSRDYSHCSLPLGLSRTTVADCSSAAVLASSSHMRLAGVGVHHSHCSAEVAVVLACCSWLDCCCCGCVAVEGRWMRVCGAAARPEVYKLVNVPKSDRRPQWRIL